MLEEKAAKPRTCDFHIDLPWQILKQDLNEIIKSSPHHVSVENMNRGGLDVAFMPLYISKVMIDETAGTYRAWDNYLSRQIQTISESGQVGKRFLFSIENMQPWVKLGLWRCVEYFRNTLKPKVVGLVHNHTNALADSATDYPKHHGLSPLGKQLVRALDAAGILIDVSHASEEVIFQLEDLVTHPIVATHSASAKLCPHPRNLSDRALRFIATSGGIVGVPFVKKFLGEKFFGEHVAHIVDVMGIRQVGIGSDLDGATLVPELDRVEKWKTGVQEHLSAIGMTPDEMDRVMGENILSLFPSI